MGRIFDVRFIVDDAGSLIDMETGKQYDYFEEVIDLLNDIADEQKAYREISKMKVKLIKKYYNYILRGN